MTLLGKFLCLSVLVCSFFCSSPSYAYSGNLEDVTLNVTVTRQVAPDLAFIHYSVFGNGQKPEQASSEAAAKAGAVKKALLGSGVAEANLIQENYNLYPVYGEQSKVTGYRVNHGLKVKVEDLAVLGRLLTAVTAAGADSVSSVEYTLKDPNRYQEELLKEAVAIARTKAEVVASAGGRRLGRMLMARLSGSTYGSRAANTVMLAKAAARDTGAVELAGKNIQVSCDVETAFALQ